MIPAYSKASPWLLRILRMFFVPVENLVGDPCEETEADPSRWCARNCLWRGSETSGNSAEIQPTIDSLDSQQAQEATRPELGNLSPKRSMDCLNGSNRRQLPTWILHEFTTTVLFAERQINRKTEDGLDPPNPQNGLKSQNNDYHIVQGT